MSPDVIRPGSAGQPSEDNKDDGLAQSNELASSVPPSEAEIEDETEQDDAWSTDQPSSEDEASLEFDVEPIATEETERERSHRSERRPRARRERSPQPPRKHHGRFSRLYYGETNIDFVGRKSRWFMISSVVILAGVISLATRGLNLGIEFVGGTAWTVQTRSVSVDQAKSALQGIGISGATITILGQATSHATLDISAKLGKNQSAQSSTSEANQVAAVLAKLAHVPVNSIGIEQVGPSWGGEVTHKAIVALIAFFLLIALYISVFFEWRMAFAAIVAVLHDIVVTVGVYSLTGFDVTPDTVVAFLTILGYSLYDTIVVFDRVRDNVKTLAERGRLTFSDLVNLSMNQTLARSINTSLVAIMPILAVLVLGAQILGAQTLQYFGLALFIGLTTGAYSSIFIASPLVAMMKEREPRYQRIRERIEQRGGQRLLLSPAALAAGTLGLEAPAPRAPRTPRQATTTISDDGTQEQVPAADSRESGRAEPAKRTTQPRRPSTPTRRGAARTKRKGGRR